MASILRRRIINSDNVAEPLNDNFKFPPGGNKTPAELKHGTYWLARIVILRYIAFIYFVAFLVAFNQNESLIGKDGLLPANIFLKSVEHKTKKDVNMRFWSIPTLLWLFDYDNHLNFILNGISLIGLILSTLVIISGCANIIVMLLLWVLYHSIVGVGQRWYSFGWESQLLETGFLAAFLCPLFTWKQFPERTLPPFCVIFCFRWLIFRIMLGAGLIKVRGDKCWHDLTCMNYHYETQPVPNPLSYYMHQEPEAVHKFETSVNHFIELLVPFLVLLPGLLCRVGGYLQILFQVLLIISGNLSFLNWLTITPSMACFDDRSIAWMFSRPKRMKVCSLQNSETHIAGIGCYVRKTFNFCFVLMISYLSIPVAKNLLSSKQLMNYTFEPLRIVNTYGAFGSVTKERTEVIFEGTRSHDPNGPNVRWLEYEFKCKPGSTLRRPCLISPYHYRLDWLMWFAALQDYRQNGWLIHLAIKFLKNDNSITGLIAYNPFQGQPPPRWIRAEHYKYKYTKLWSNSSSKGHWWKRRKIGSYIPTISLEKIIDYALSKGYQWPVLKS